MSEDKKEGNFRAKSIQEIKNENKNNKIIKEIQAKKLITGAVMILCMVALVFLAVKLNKKCIAIYVNENKIGIVENKDSLEEIKDELRQKIAKDIDVLDIEFNEKVDGKKVLRLEKQKYDKSIISSKETIMTGLEANLTYKIKAYVLNVNEKEVAVFENAKQFNEVLNRVRNDVYQDNQTFDFIKNKNKLKEYFYGDITITNRFVDKATEIASSDIIISSLEEKQEQKTYKVRPNDSIVTIASSNNMTVDQIVAANKGFKENQILRPGQEINLIIPMAKLAVVSYVEQSYEKVIEPPLEKTIRDDEYEDYQKVLKEGKEGRKKVTVRRKMVGDVEVSTETVREEEIEAAEKKEIEIGSKKLPAKAMKGLFMMPTVGTITTYFMENRGSYNHKGVDIANSRGTCIYASYVGEVIKVENRHDYGKMVVIKHSSGYQTLYAHMSEFYVEVGDKVDKGDLIGVMGSTGDSTGNHLHFELSKDGVLKNPFDYIY